MNPAGPVSNWRRRATRPVAAGAARLPGPAFLACLAPLASLALLAACGGGGSGTASSPVAAPEAGTVTTLSCVAEASATTALGRLHNNTWNRQAVGSQPWQQCLQQRGSGPTLEVGWAWQWPADASTVLAYPSLVLGAKPWEPGPGNDPRFPRRIDTLNRLLLAHEVSTSASGRYNLAWSLWLTRTPTVANPPDPRAITAELMVWAGAGSGDWTGGRLPDAQITVDGVAWLVYVVPSQGDASGGSSHRWAYVAYVAPSAGTAAGGSFSVDARKLLADAQARGVVGAQDHVASVELGNEIAGGSGSTWVRRFSVTLD